MSFEEERRHRLAAAILGAPGQELVTVRAADLRACLAAAEKVQEALQLVGENQVLRRTVIAKTVAADRTLELEAEVAILRPRALHAGRVPVLEAQLDAARARAEAAETRIRGAFTLLQGGPAAMGRPAKLTEDDKAQIVSRSRAGEAQVDLAEEYDVSDARISQIVRGAD